MTLNYYKSDLVSCVLMLYSSFIFITYTVFVLRLQNADCAIEKHMIYVGKM